MEPLTDPATNNPEEVSLPDHADTEHAKELIR